MMRVSQPSIVSFCDFCKERVKAESSCSVCGKDICRRHLYEVAIPKARLAEPPRTRAPDGQPPFRVPTFVVLEPVCPECASSSSLSELMEVVLRNRADAALPKTRE
jgi:hypothetical protein